MNKILVSIQKWIDKHVPSEMMISYCDAGRLYGLYKLEIPEPDAIWAARITKAIDRLTAQMPMKVTCSHELAAFLVYDEDKAALSRMCNNYCIFLAENYDQLPFFMQPVATKLYQDFTTIMLKFK